MNLTDMTDYLVWTELSSIRLKECPEKIEHISAANLAFGLLQLHITHRLGSTTQAFRRLVAKISMTKNSEIYSMQNYMTDLLARQRDGMAMYSGRQNSTSESGTF